MLPGLGGKAAGGSRCGLPNGLEQGTQGCCALYMDPRPVWAGVAICPPLQPVRLGDCRRRLCQPTAVGVPDGMAAGCCFCFVFLGLPQSAFAGADGRVLRFDRLFPSVRLGDRRDRLYLPTAVGVPNGVAAGCFYLFCLFTL